MLGQPAKKFFAISIVNYHSIDLIIKLLPSLGEIRCDIFIIDNASGVDECTKIQEIGQSYDHIYTSYNNTNRGFAGGNNDNLEYIKKTGIYEYILFLNPDTTLPINFLQEFMNEITHYQQKHQKTILYGPTMQIKLGGRLFTYYGSIVNRWLVQSYHNTNDKKIPDFISGCCLAIAYNVFGEVCFDESFFLYFEEVDLCFTLKERGFNLHITNQNISHHQDYIKNRKKYFLYSLSRSRILFAKKRSSWYTWPTIYIRSCIIILYYFCTTFLSGTKHVIKGMYHGSINGFDRSYFDQT